MNDTYRVDPMDYINGFRIVLFWLDTFKDCSIHLSLDKMIAILADDHFLCIFLNDHDRIQIRISLWFVSRSPINNIPAMV